MVVKMFYHEIREADRDFLSDILAGKILNKTISVYINIKVDAEKKVLYDYAHKGKTIYQLQIW